MDNLTVQTEQLALLEESDSGFAIQAIEDTEFFVALTEPWPYPTVHQYGQMHTNQKALEKGSDTIQKIYH